MERILPIWFLEKETVVFRGVVMCKLIKKISNLKFEQKVSLFWLCYSILALLFMAAVIAIIIFRYEANASEIDQYKGEMRELSKKSKNMISNYSTLRKQELNAHLKHEKEVKKMATETREISSSYRQEVKKMDKEHKQIMSKYIKEAKDPFIESLGITDIISNPEIRKYVFLSFNMPDQSLKVLLKAAKQKGYSPVIRGFIEGSMTKTVSKIKSMIDMTKEGVAVDPEAFEEFNITKVPSFVIAEDYRCDDQDNCSKAKYNKVTGNVTLDYAESYMIKNGEKLCIGGRSQ